MPFCMVDVCGATRAEGVERNPCHSGKLVVGYVGCIDGTMVCGDTGEESLDAMISSVLAFKFSHSDECQTSVIRSVGSTAVC